MKCNNFNLININDIEKKIKITDETLKKIKHRIHNSGNYIGFSNKIESTLLSLTHYREAKGADNESRLKGLFCENYKIAKNFFKLS